MINGPIKFNNLIQGDGCMQLFQLKKVFELNRAQVKENHKKYLNPVLTKMMGTLNFDKQYVKAKGTKVWDSDGNEYLDFLGGYGALSLGHNPEEVTIAIKEVLDKKFPNILQASIGTVSAALAQLLAEITPGELRHSFFTNSGTESVEGALKTARAASGKKVILSTIGAFHGKTFGSLSASGREKYKKPFEPLLQNFEQIPFGDTETLEKRLKKKDVAAFIVEPIQGEAGVIVPPLGYLKKVRQICDEYETILIMDEVQTGFGRTGRLFACDYEKIAPDIMALSKAIGGGVMPLGAFICNDKIWNLAYGNMEKCTLHTSTFGGNALACAAGIASINTIIQKNLSKEAEQKGSYFLKRLNGLKSKYDIIKEVRGKGLLIGIEFMQPEGLIKKIAGNVVYEYLASLISGILFNEYRIITAYTLNNPNVIRLEPPLIVSMQEIDRVVDALDEIFSKHKNIISIALAGAKHAIFR